MLVYPPPPWPIKSVVTFSEPFVGLQEAGFNNEVDLGMDTKNETQFLP